MGKKDRIMECRRCTHWRDKTMEELSEDVLHRETWSACGCELHGYTDHLQIESCPDYQVTDNLFSLCHTCGIPVPRICLMLGECLNCTDTDLYCVEQCSGTEERVFCTHYQRLRKTGYVIIEEGQVYEIYPVSEKPIEVEPDLPLIQLYEDPDENTPEEP